MEQDSETPDTLPEEATLFDMDTVQHSGDLHPEQGQELAVTDLGTLRNDAASGTLPSAPPSLAGLSNNETSAPTREPRVFFDNFLDLLKTHRREFSLGVAAVTLAGLVGGALFLKNSEAPEPRAVVATQPIVAPTPHETAMPSPTDIPAVPVATAPSETSSNTSVELGTSVPVKADFFRGIINESRVSELESEIPELSKSIAPDFIVAAATEQGVTAAAISKYQDEFRKAYNDPIVYRLLGDPQGWMTAESLSKTVDKAGIATDITVASDNFLSGIAAGIGDKVPGANTDLLGLTSLSRELIDGDKALINGGSTRFSRATSGDVVAAQDYTTIDGHNVTLVETVSSYDDGHKRIGIYVLVPVDHSLANLPENSFLAVPFFGNTI